MWIFPGFSFRNSALRIITLVRLLFYYLVTSFICLYIFIICFHVLWCMTQPLYLRCSVFRCHFLFWWFIFGRDCPYLSRPMGQAEKRWTALFLKKPLSLTALRILLNNFGRRF